MTKQKIEYLFQKIIKEATIGNADQLKILIKQSNSIDCSKALIISAVNGHTECVKLLIPLSNPKTNDSEALRLASSSGHTECVKLLIPVSDPKAKNNYALRWASSDGYDECVNLLIPVSDAKNNNSIALESAAVRNNINCVKLLLPYSDISKWDINNWKYISSDMQNFIQSYYSKKSLTENVLINNSKISKTKKIHKI